MSENSDKILGTICMQWASSLALNICHSLETDSKTLSAKIPSLCGKDLKEAQQLLESGVKLMDQYNSQVSKQMLHSLGCTVLDFAADSRFPRVFSSLVTTMHSLFIVNYSGAGKAKALHTDQVLQNTTLTPFEQLKCSVFEFLSNLLASAANSPTSNISKIKEDIIAIIFRFLEHDQPNAVRAAAGQIVAALSVSPNHCDNVIKLFWARFSKCKKDEDFRNFSALIDGIVNLSLSMKDVECTKVVITFFKSFLDNAKRIERGVLRLKFLDALTEIIKRLNQYDKAASSVEYTKQLNDIWNLVLKWSSKGKHTAFCYTFLQNMLTNSFPSFFVSNNGATLLDQIIKYAKNEPNGALELLVNWMKSVPNEYVRNEDFQSNVNKVIIPFLFPVKDQIRSLKYTKQNQIESCVLIVAEIAVKQIQHFVTFVTSVLASNQANEAQKKLRMICIQAIARVAQTSPQILNPVSKQLNQYVESILLSKDTEEFENILPAFPLIISEDKSKQKTIVEILFKVSFSESSASSAAFSSLCNYIEKYVKLSDNLIWPINFINQAIAGISLKPSFEALKSISLLMRLTEAVTHTLQPSISEFSKITSGSVSVTTMDISSLLQNIDNELLPILISADKSDREIALDFIIMYNNEVFEALGKIAFNESHFSLPSWCSSLPKESDVAVKLSEIIKISPEAANTYFENLLKFWKENSKTIDASLIPRIVLSLTNLCNKFSPATKSYYLVVFNYLKGNPASTEFASVASLLPSSLWTSFGQEFSSWMDTNKLNASNFWPQIVTFYFAFAQRSEFPEHLKEAQFDTYYRLFIDQFWRTIGERENTYALTEKALRILSIYIDNYQSKKVIDEAHVKDFITCIINGADLSQHAQFPSSYPDTILTTLHRVFSYTKIETKELFDPICDYLVKICNIYQNDERIQLLVCQVFSDFLRENPILLKSIFAMVFSNSENFASHAILAIANAYQAHDNFGELYEDGHATIFATTILHITNEIIKPRQAAFKLMCLMMSRKNDIFTTEAPLDLMMPLTSPSPTGYQIQAKQFSEFASTSIKPDAALIAFRMIADEMGHMTQKQRPLMTSLVGISPILALAKPLKDVALTLVRISSQCNNNNAQIAETIKTLWLKFADAINDNEPENINELLQTLFEYGTSQEDIKSPQSQAVVIALCYIFLVFPKETTAFLIPNLLKKYELAAPSLQELSDFLSKATLTFTPTKQEIITANALSQIFLMIEERDLFLSLFSDKLSMLLVISVFIRSEDAFNIGQFHPLLESLLDAALFRFAESNKMFSRNLKALQDVNLITRATSLDAQYRIITEEGSRALLAYDEEAVRALVALFNTINPQFQEAFFSSILTVSFQVNPNDDRASEPFLIIRAVGQQMSTDSLFFILLYTLYSVRSGKTQLLDCIVDCIHGHLLADDLSIETFKIESMPAIIVFILYLSLKLKQSQSIHIMKILSETIDNVNKRCESDREVFDQVVKYMEKFNGDEYMASLMMKFVTESKTFGDANCAGIIKCLSSLSIIYGSKNNWCSLLADLTDGARKFIGQCGGTDADRVISDNEYSTAEEFASLLIETYSGDDKKIHFIISFICNIMCTSASIDLNKDSAVLMMLQAFLNKDEVKLTGDMNDKLIKFITLMSMACEEKWKTMAAPLIVTLLKKSDHLVQAMHFSYTAMQPQFTSIKMRQYSSYKDVERTIIDPTFLPQFELTKFGGIEKTVITDLWDFISSKISSDIHYITPGKSLQLSEPTD